MKNIEDEINSVTVLCGHIEDMVKNNKASLFNNYNTKANGQEKKEQRKAKKLQQLSMDDGVSHLKVNKTSEIREKKIKCVSVDKITERLYKIKPFKKQEDLKNKKNVNYKKLLNTPLDTRTENLLRRLKENQNEHKTKLLDLKAQRIQEEIKEVKSKPTINAKSKMIVTTSEDFLTRQEKYKEEHDTKLSQTKKTKEEKDEETFKKNMKKSKLKFNKSEIEDKVNTLIEWESIRERKLKQIEDQVISVEKESCTFKPKINKKTEKIINHTKPKEIIERLYIKDIIKRRINKELLEGIYTPSFQPNLTCYQKEFQKQKKEAKSP